MQQPERLVAAFSAVDEFSAARPVGIYHFHPALELSGGGVAAPATGASEFPAPAGRTVNGSSVVQLVSKKTPMRKRAAPGINRFMREMTPQSRSRQSENPPPPHGASLAGCIQEHRASSSPERCITTITLAVLVGHVFLWWLSNGNSDSVNFGVRDWRCCWSRAILLQLAKKP